MVEFYSQNFEDRALSKIFRREAGTCVEVGAHDGVHFSNTYHFEQLGWRCILVEPNHDLCEKIRRVRRATLFECAASGQVGEAVFYMGTGSDDVYSSLESASVVERSKPCTSYLVCTRPLDLMLEEAEVTSIDFITIDVEGHEAVVLKGFTLDRWRPLVVLLEDNSDLANGEVEDHMRKAGYFRFYRTGANDWYARKSAGRIGLLARIVSAGCFSLKCAMKGIVARALLHKIRSIKRMLFKGHASTT